jgi:2-hydroxy-3-keto-5-methylthiopentenyl-1-phosphate phosphatase
VKYLALFDFDGTITKKDSLIQFIRFAVGDTGWNDPYFIDTKLVANTSSSFMSE